MGVKAAEGGGQQPNKQQQQQRQLWPAWRQQFVDAIEFDSTKAEDGEGTGALGIYSLHS
jgi:hypothetical protein